MKKFHNENYRSKIEMQLLIKKIHHKKVMGKKDKWKSGYWSSDIELFARAFSSYVFDTLEKRIEQSPYLVKEEAQGVTSSLMRLAGEEAQRVNAAFDTLFEIIQYRETSKGIELYQEGTNKANTLNVVVPERIVSTREEAKTILKELQGKKIVCKSNGVEARISRETWKKITSNSSIMKSEKNGFPEEKHLIAGVNIDALFESAILNRTHEDKRNDPHIKAIHRYNSSININGENINALLTVKELFEDGHKIYSLELLEIKKEPSDNTGEVEKSNSAPATKALSSDNISSDKQNASGGSEILLKKNANGELLAPNGRVSNLNEKQWRQVRSSAFKAWFGDWEGDPENASKAVDENGEPRVVYHGTRSGGFNVFEHGKGVKNDAGWLGKGFYFYSDRHDSNGYAKGDKAEVKELFLNVREPYFATYQEMENLAELNDEDSSEAFTDEIKSEGCDGVYYNGDLRGEYVVFDSNQIKSATHNSGTFDSSNANILYQDMNEIKPRVNESITIDDIRAVVGKEVEFVGDGVAQEAYLHKMLPVIESTRAFGRELEKYKNDVLIADRPITVCKTSRELQQSGANNLDIVVDKSIIKKMIDKHNLTLEQIKMLPIALNQPIMVFNSATDTTGNSLVALVELKDSKQNNVVVALGLDMNRGGSYVANVIKSAYGRNNQKDAITTWVQDGLLKYEHKKRTQLFLRRIGLQLPKHPRTSSINTIHDESGFVKLETWEKLIKDAKNTKNEHVFYQNIKEGRYFRNLEKSGDNAIMKYLLSNDMKVRMPDKAQGVVVREMWKSLPKRLQGTLKSGYPIDEIHLHLSNAGLINDTITYARDLYEYFHNTARKLNKVEFDERNRMKQIDAEGERRNAFENGETSSSLNFTFANTLSNPTVWTPDNMRFSRYDGDEVYIGGRTDRNTFLFREVNNLSAEIELKNGDYVLVDKGSLIVDNIPIDLAPSDQTVIPHKGMTRFVDDKKFVTLFQHADTSTFVHEFGHIFLKEMLELSQRGVGNEQLLTDLETTKRWVFDQLPQQFYNHFMRWGTSLDEIAQSPHYQEIMRRYKLFTADKRLNERSLESVKVFFDEHKNMMDLNDPGRTDDAFTSQMRHFMWKQGNELFARGFMRGLESRDYYISRLYYFTRVCNG